jgi:hypothetical protein
MNMKKETTDFRFLQSTPQEQLAYAWAVAECEHLRFTSLNPRVLESCRKATAQLHVSDALLLLSEVPALR